MKIPIFLSFHLGIFCIHFFDHDEFHGPVTYPIRLSHIVGEIKLPFARLFLMSSFEFAGVEALARIPLDVFVVSIPQRENS